jgi:hypothetical protein
VRRHFTIRHSGHAFRVTVIALFAPFLLGALGDCSNGARRVETPQGDAGNAATHVRTYSLVENREEQFRAMRITTDGGYIAVGESWTENGTSSPLGPDAMWATKIGSDGSVAWHQRLRGEVGVEARANDVQQAPDGGYLIAGRAGDRATVLKLDADGRIVWQWAYVALNPNFPSRAEASSIHVAADGRVLVSGSVAHFERREPTGEPRFRPTVPFVWRFDEHGRMTGDWTSGEESLSGALAAHAGYHANAVIALDDGFIVAGEAFDANGFNNVKWAARVRFDQSFPNSPNRDEAEWAGSRLVWERTYGPGAFRAIRRTAAGFVLAGSIGGGPGQFPQIAVDELAEGGDLIRAHEYRGMAPRVEAIEETGDGGYVLAGTEERFCDRAWVMRLDRTGSVRWQNTYGMAMRDSGPRGCLQSFAFAVDRRSAGGFRVAGRLDSSRYALATSPSDDHPEGGGSDGWIFDLDDDGALVDINSKCGLSVTPMNMAVTDVTGNVPILVYSDLNRANDSNHIDRQFVTAHPTSAVIETMSGPSGVLPAPSIGTNSPSRSFYWSGVPEASGFVLYYSRDDVTYTRMTTAYAYGFDHPRSGSATGGYYKLVSFNAAGYSEFSSVVQIIEREGPESTTTLFVTREGAGGSVSSTPSGITCGDDCSETYSTANGGTEVTLEASGDEDWTFISWAGCDSAAGRLCEVLLDRADLNRQVIARFVEAPPGG